MNRKQETDSLLLERHMPRRERVPPSKEIVPPDRTNEQLQAELDHMWEQWQDAAASR